MKNSLAAKLRQGTPCLNGWLSLPSAMAAETMARVGWDSLTVDMQHGVHDFMSAVACMQGIAASGIPALVRVPQNDGGLIGQVLDAGAWGVICPMVNTAEDARQFVAACRYGPAGKRSFGPNRAAAFGTADAPYHTFANDEVLAIPMIETVEALENLDAILDVPGVNGCYVGPSDLSLSMGLDARFDREEPAFISTLDKIAKATAARGQFAGIHCLSAGYARKMVDRGFLFTTVASDAYFMAKGAGMAVAEWRSNA